MSNLRDTKEGLIVPIKVNPRASKTEIIGWQDGWLKIKVREPPEKGEANRAIVHLLAETFKLPQSKIILLRGANGRQKEFLLIGYTKFDFDRVVF
jgi:uncharacterized protein